MSGSPEDHARYTFDVQDVEYAVLDLGDRLAGMMAESIDDIESEFKLALQCRVRLLEHIDQMLTSDQPSAIADVSALAQAYQHLQHNPAVAS